MSANYFLKMIRRLRGYEEVVLYANILKIQAAEETEVAEFLAAEYRREANSYPFTAPPFDSEAAVWAAETVYIAAQLLLYRENKEAELETLLPVFSHTPDASAMLSADLCLRFLPDLIAQLKIIDSEDKLINILHEALQQWHYSGIPYLQSPESPDFTAVTANQCLYQLYTDRVIENRNLRLARHPAIHKMIRAALGDFGSVYWSDFKLETTINE